MPQRKKKSNHSYYEKKKYLGHFRSDVLYQYILIIVWLYTRQNEDLVWMMNKKLNKYIGKKGLKYYQSLQKQLEQEHNMLTFKEMRDIYLKAIEGGTKDDAYTPGSELRHEEKHKQVKFSEWIIILGLNDKKKPVKFSKATFYRLRPVLLEMEILTQDGDFYTLNLVKAYEAILNLDDKLSLPDDESGTLCPSCHKSVAPDFTLCPYCGSKLGKPVCANCHKEFDADFKMCPYCGTPKN